MAVQQGKTKELVYEEAAEKKMVEAWVCKKCKQTYSTTRFGVDLAEHIARSCCAQEVPCRSDGCSNRTKKSMYIYCNECMEKRENARWEKMPRKDWDGESTIAIAETDHFFFDQGSLADYLHDEGLRPDEIAMFHCRPDYGQQFDMDDYLGESVPNEDGLCADSTEIEKAVNDWIAKHGPFCWWQENIVVTPESIAKVLESYGPFGKEDSLRDK